jgi:hypothetical protein
LVQYQYGHITLPVLAFNIAHTGNGISALWFSTSIGTFHHWHWHSKMVPVLVLAFFHFDSVRSQLPVLVFNNGFRNGTVISALWFSTGKGTVHYW